MKIESEVPEIVLLLNSAFSFSAEFLQSAYESVLGITLSISEPDSTNCIVGKYPTFVIQHKGVLLSLVSLTGAYGSNDAQVLFPHHDHEAARSSLSFLQKLRFSLSESWVSLSWLRTEPNDGIDPYEHITRFLSPFLFDTHGIVDPITNRAVLLNSKQRKSPPSNLIELIAK